MLLPSPAPDTVTHTFRDGLDTAWGKVFMPNPMSVQPAVVVNVSILSATLSKRSQASRQTCNRTATQGIPAV